METVLQVKNLSKSYPQTKIQVLNDLSFKVNKGEFISIIGPSGCGKTTLFHLLAGIEEPSSGEVVMGKKLLKKRKGVFGYMLQNPLLFPWRTILDNLLIGPDLLQLPKKDSKAAALGMLKTFGLLEYANMYPQVLSGGMKQRVALLRTVLFQKNFLLLDEPFGALDALSRLSCQLWLLQVWKKYQSSILFITHDINEAILLSDKILVMGKNCGPLIGEFKVPLPRPRKKEDLISPKVKSLEKKLLELLFI